MNTKFNRQHTFLFEASRSFSLLSLFAFVSCFAVAGFAISKGAFANPQNPQDLISAQVLQAEQEMLDALDTNESSPSSPLYLTQGGFHPRPVPIGPGGPRPGHPYNPGHPHPIPVNPGHPRPIPVNPGHPGHPYNPGHPRPVPVYPGYPGHPHYPGYRPGFSVTCYAKDHYGNWFSAIGPYREVMAVQHQARVSCYRASGLNEYQDPYFCSDQGCNRNFR